MYAHDCLLARRNPRSTAYNMPQLFSLEGDLDRERLEKAFCRLLERHAILRSAFSTREGQAVQEIRSRVSFRIETETIEANGLLSDALGEFLSGEVLSSKLGLRPTEVYRQIESLRSRGYRIESRGRAGYRLVSVPDRLTQLDPTLELSVITDQARYIRQSVREVLQTALYGGALAILVLFPQMFGLSPH